MKFGTLFEMEPGPKPWADGREHQVFHEAADQARLVDELGWDYVWAVEHHFLTEYSSCSAPEVFLGWMAGQTKQVRLGAGVFQASRPINHFWRTAERTACLDIVSDGRFDVGIGRGFTTTELGAFGVDPGDTRQAQVETIEMLQHVFLEDTFSWDGVYYTLDERELQPKPIQRPHPPLWMAATQPQSWGVAADLGVGILAFGETDPAKTREKVKLYRERVAKAKPASGMINDQIAFAPNMYCAETDEEALETCAKDLLFFTGMGLGYIMGWSKTPSKDYEYYADMGEKMLDLSPLPADETRGLSPDAARVKAGVAHGLYCVGSPETCRNFIAANDDADIDQMIMVAQFGNMSNDDIKKSIRLLSSEVLPEFSDKITGGAPVPAGSR